MKAVGYVRVSTEEQAREGYGLAAQEQSVRAHCQAHGWELVEIYSDAGRSGKNIKQREALNRLMADAQTGAFERVIFWKFDRLGRNLRDLLAICDRLDEAGVGIVSIQENIDTGTAIGRMQRSLMGAFAEFERDTIVDRIKVALAEKARQGEILGPLPLGYVRDEDGAIVADPIVGPLIRTAYERYSTGTYSMRDMASWATQVGLRSTAGNPLDRLSIRKLLSNITYTGQVSYRGTVVSNGKHPAIVDAALFTAVQETARSRNRYHAPAQPFGKQPYPLSGVATCGYCSTSLVGMTRSQKSDRYRYSWYRCSTAHRRGKHACKQPMVRTHLLEDQIASYVGGMRLPPEYLGEVVAELRSRQQYRNDDPGEAASLQRQQDRWRKLFVMGEIDDRALKAETAPLKARLAEIDRPREVLDVEAAVNYLRDVGSLWAESPRSLQREFVREVFQRITVEGKQVTTIIPHPAYAPLFVLDRRERFGQAGPEFCSMAPGTGLEPVT